ncbi:DedA family protein [Aestuariirhabdus sp. Z084]|uniref:YqaA family protein n=1 Tax=Aestuariirhabdus haliotis TaxID=2918751 RepID=UPI00201B394B|nr:YqaA family protein [Aestuariirhabdus haliotis]MCL6417410.1 DedA family protein [Aestuariirhabdus haliotis]MCL6421354.1 DedA family protein [Aestuariirhabdus haliotis]
MDYLLLAGAAFLAATLVPFSSEALLSAMQLQGYNLYGLWLAATLGNTLGSCVNWQLGRYLLHFRDRRWFPFTEDQLQRAQGQFNRWGLWSLLLSWVPLIGDPITFVAGVFRVRFIIFIALVALAKALRYAVVIGITNGLVSVW